MSNESKTLIFLIWLSNQLTGCLEEEKDECHPRAVPCHIGPDIDNISSGVENVSLEVVRNS